MCQLIQRITILLGCFLGLVPLPVVGEEMLRPFQSRDGAWGYVNSEHCWVIKPQYHFAEPFRQGYAQTMGRNGIWTLVNRIENSLAHVAQGRFVGVMSENFVYVVNNARFSSYVGINGQKIDGLSNRFSYPEFRMVNGLAPYQKVPRQGYGFVNANGETIIEPQFEHAFSFSEGLAAVQSKENKLWGFINFEGQITIPHQFERVASFTNGLAPVKVGERWGYADRNGNIQIEPRFDFATPFMGSTAAVKIDNRWGYIDRSGNLVINAQYDEARNFSEGLAAVKIDSRWGYINTQGTVVIEPQFMIAEPFEASIARVNIGSDWWTTDWHSLNNGRDGRVLSVDFEDATRGRDRWQSIDTSGRVLPEPSCGVGVAPQ